MAGTLWAVAFRLFMNFIDNPGVQDAVSKYGRKVLRASAKSFLNAVKNGRVSRERENVR
jgi:hypothetical protein